MTSPPATPIARTTNRRLIARNALANAVRVGSSGCLSILLPLILAALVNHRLYAVWAFAFGLGAYVTYLDIGVPTSVQTIVALGAASQRTSVVRSAVTAGLRITLMLCAIVMFLAVTAAVLLPDLAPTMPPSLTATGGITLVLLVLGQCANLLGVTASAFFAGLQRNEIPARILTPSQLAAFVAAVAASLATRSLVVMGAAYALPLIVGCAVLFWRLHMETNQLRCGAASERYSSLRLLRHSGPLALWSICALAALGAGTAIVGHFAYRDVVPYALAGVVASGVAGLASAVATPFLPEFVHSVTASRAGLPAKLVVASRLNAALLFTATAAAIVTLPWWSALFIGARLGDTSQAWVTVLIMLGGCALHWTGTPLSLAFIATNTHHKIVVPQLVQAVCSVAISLALVGSLGAIGVATGVASGAVVGIVLMAWSTRLGGMGTVAGWRVLWWSVVVPAAGLALPIVSVSAGYELGVTRSALQVVTAVVGLSAALIWGAFVVVPADERSRLVASFAARMRPLTSPVTPRSRKRIAARSD